MFSLEREGVDVEVKGVEGSMFTAELCGKNSVEEDPESMLIIRGSTFIYVEATFLGFLVQIDSRTGIMV